MKWLLSLSLATAAATAATAAPSPRFDLLCTGTLQESPNGPKAPHSERYRIDLDANRWCEAECANGMAIQEVSPDFIILQRKRASPPLWADINHVIARVQGTVTSFVLSRDGYFRKFEGSCERQPFSGMPTPKF